MSQPKKTKAIDGRTVSVHTGCGTMFVTINGNKDSPDQILVHMGKAGVCGNAVMDALGRMITVALKAGAKLKDIIHELKGTTCSQQNDESFSCPDAVARALEKN